jgi:RimJ/RimL family protein N-acetyltransferase
MLLAAMDWARIDWGRRCIVACHFVDNPASGVVLGRAGFLYTGRVEPRPCRARGEAVPSRWMVWLA